MLYEFSLMVMSWFSITIKEKKTKLRITLKFINIQVSWS